LIFSAINRSLYTTAFVGVLGAATRLLTISGRQLKLACILLPELTIDRIEV